MDSQDQQQNRSQDMERWMCPNHDTPVLLAMVDDCGHLEIKVRNRVWSISDYSTVTATCPKCGKEHTRRIITQH